MRLAGISLSLALFLMAPVAVFAQETEEAKPVDGVALVPADTTILVSIPSFAQLQSKVLGIANGLGQGEQAKMGLMMAKMRLGPLGAMLDDNRPFYLAVSMPKNLMGGEEPGVTLIAPVKDAAKAKDEMGLPVFGGYAIRSSAGPYAQPSALAPITKGLPRGDLTVRVALSNVWGSVKPLMDAGMGDQIADMAAEQLAAFLEDKGMDGIDPDAIVDGALKGFVNFMSSAGNFDLAFGMDGSNLAIDSRLGINQGSPLSKALSPSTSLSSMGKFLPADSAVSALLSLDWGKATEWFMPLMEQQFKQLPPEMAKKMMASIKTSLEMYKYMGRDTAYGFGFTPQGTFSMTAIQSVTDVKAYMGAMEKNMKALTEGDLPVSMTSKTRKLGDDEVTSITLDLSGLPGVQGEQVKEVMKSFLGPRGFSYDLVPVGNKVLMQWGGSDEALAAQIKRCKSGKGSYPSTLANALMKAGQTPHFALGMDLSSILKSVGHIAKSMGETKVPDMSKLPATPMTLYAGPDRGGYRCGFSLDMKGLASVIKTLQR